MSYNAPVFILGMHRSGTSCLTGTLQQCGLYLGEVSEKKLDNLKGNRESQKVIDLNNEILRFNGGGWRNVPSKLYWTNQHSDTRDNIIEEFSRDSEGVWGIKDPRLLITYPFWRDGFSEIKKIGIFRHPLKVAHSLEQRRNSVPIKDGLHLWKVYNNNLLYLLDDEFFPLISFDSSKNDFNRIARLAANSSGLNCSDCELDFYSNNLRHQDSIVENIEFSSDIQIVYEKLLSYHMQTISLLKG